MPDNIDVTPGTGATVRTVDRAGVETQVMVLDIGGAGAEVLAPGSAARGLAVEPRANVVSSSVASAGLTTASTSYSVGDVLGTGWSFTGAARATGGTGRVVGAVLLDAADVIAGVDLYLASASIAFGTDNAAPSVSDADAAKLGMVIGMSAIDVGGARLAQAHGLSVPYVCDATTLLVYARTRDANGFFSAVTDLTLRLFLELD